MFTGIITHQAMVLENQPLNQSSRLKIQLNDALKKDFEALEAGESIAINGVCLTLLPQMNDYLEFDLSPETLKVTTLSTLSSGTMVNLERAMAGNSRWGGHLVTGHVDTTAYVARLQKIDGCVEMSLGGFTVDMMEYLIPKGCVTVEGVSLTINQLKHNALELMLVPHTLKMTTLGQCKLGQTLNMEFDYFARMIAHQLKLRMQVES